MEIKNSQIIKTLEFTIAAHQPGNGQDYFKLSSFFGKWLLYTEEYYCSLR